MLGRFAVSWNRPGTDAALSELFKRSRNAPEQIWFGLLDDPVNQKPLGDIKVARALVYRLPILTSYPAVAKLLLNTRVDNSFTPKEVIDSMRGQIE